MQIICVFGLFNDISTSVVYSIPKRSLLKTSKGTIYYYGEENGVHTFPKGISSKVKVIAWLEFELAYYNSEVSRFNHYATVINFGIKINHKGWRAVKQTNITKP